MCLCVLFVDTELNEVGTTDHGEKIISLLRSYVVEVNISVVYCAILHAIKHSIMMCYVLFMLSVHYQFYSFHTKLFVFVDENFIVAI